MNTTQATATKKIEIGMGATIHGYTDTRACTVIAVSKSGNEITLQRDKATLLNGANSGEPDAMKCYPGGFCAHFEGEQRYLIERDANGSIEKFSRRIFRGVERWVRVGESAKGGQRATIGTRHEHYDFNF